MSVRYFCDICQAELAPVHHGRLKAVIGDLAVEVMTRVKGTWNGGQVCHDCIRKVVATGIPDPSGE
jgi:hypothetical protein